MTEIIPAIDIIDGKCVRLTRGDYALSRVYASDPLEMARLFYDNGACRLHLVDLDGAKSKHVVNWHVIERIASATPLVIDFGGGVKSHEDLHIAFDSGASMVTAGSVAVDNADEVESWIHDDGADKIILGADVRVGRIAVSGWTRESTHEVVPFISGWMDKGISQVISTDISVDGTLEGPSVDLYKKIRREIPDIYLIASGGVGRIEDMELLDEAGVPAAIVGKALYEGKIPLKYLGERRGDAC